MPLLEIQARPRGQEDPLEEKTATYSGILAEIIPWLEELAGYGIAELDTTEHAYTHAEAS